MMTGGGEKEEEEEAGDSLLHTRAAGVRTGGER